MKLLLTISFLTLAATNAILHAENEKNPRQDVKTPTIPEQHQSGWSYAYEQLHGKLKGADVTQSPEGIEIAFRDNVLFDTNSAAIRKEAQEDLNAVANVIKSQTGKKVRINGRADSTGSTSHNQKLSMKRAETVSSYLVDQGVSRETLSEKGYGENKPVASNTSAEGRQQNRRVDILLLN